MKRIGITQRVEAFEAYKEVRDCLDQNWVSFIFSLGFCPIILPNLEPELVEDYLAEQKIDGLILSGGNSLILSDPIPKDASTKRDLFEKQLITYAEKVCLPLIGVCRGMQLLNIFYGGKISPIKNHVATRHEICFLNTGQEKQKSVNSFHNFAIKKNNLAKDFVPLALDNSEYIEAIQHERLPFLGIMWHPEREAPFVEWQQKMFRDFLQ